MGDSEVAAGNFSVMDNGTICFCRVCLFTYSNVLFAVLFSCNIVMFTASFTCGVALFTALFTALVYLLVVLCCLLLCYL